LNQFGNQWMSTTQHGIRLDKHNANHPAKKRISY
jgi:hypothetical protein